MSTSATTKAHLLSVIVPVYNVELYLDRCVASLVNQTYSNIEIILVNDGSPDGCPQICDQWAERDSRIKVIHKINGGVSDARNVGIAAARGEYLAFVDSDDYVDQNMFETMVLALQKEKSDIVCCGRYVVCNEKKIERYTLKYPKVFSPAEALTEWLVGGALDEAVWDKLFRRELFAGMEFPKGEINEEGAVMPKLLERCNSVLHIGTPFYYYCQNGVSITRSGYSKKNSIMLKRLTDMEQYLKSTHAELLPYFDVFQCRVCQNALCMILDNWCTYRQYRQDYKAFYSRFKRSFWPSLKLCRTNCTEKIKGVLLYFNLYYLLHAIKKRKF